MKMVVVIVLIFFSQKSLSQRVVVYKSQTSFYCQFENVVRFFAKDVDCSSVVFKTDNGKIKQKDCWLSYIPERPGPTTLSVYKKGKSTLVLIDSINIVVFENKDPQVYLGYKAQGSISKEQMIAI